MKHLAAPFALAALLAGCSAAPATGVPVATGAPEAAAAERSVTLVARLAITDPTGYRLQALTAWNKADVTKVTLRLHKLAGSTWTATGATKDVANAALGSAVSLANLRMDTTYKIVAEAYDVDGARIDTQVEAANAVTFTTPALAAAATGDSVSDTTLTVSIPVQLKDKTFAGQARSGAGVAVTNGTIVSTTAAETF